MSRHLLPALSLLLLAAPARASDLKKPYEVRLVIYTAKHRLLTDVFKGRVSRQLADGLQAALGPVAKVEVLDEHEKLDDIAARGLDKALANYRARAEHRTYFVHIDLVGASYQIQTRLHDGLTGLPAPTVRKERTQDRDYVAREAALLIERDLGLLGTITSEPDAERKVTVELKGGGIDKVDLSKWVKPGEVFAVAEVGNNLPGRLLPWTYLQAEGEPEKGVVTCKFYSRYRLKSVKGLRAVLLNTRAGSLRLRLREERGDGRLGQPALPWTVQITHRGFEKGEATRVEVTTDGRRDLDTKGDDHGTFSKLAFVTVLSGQAVRARAPVPITDGGVVLLTVPAGDEDDDRVLFKSRALDRDASDAYLVQLQLVKEINALNKPEKRTEALAKVRLALGRLQKDHRKLSEAYNELKEELRTYKGKNTPDLSRVEARLKVIKDGETDLLEHVANLEKILAKENDPARKDWLFKEQVAKQLEKDAELGQAIAIYEKAPAEFQTEALKKHLASLRALWATADDDHKKAREFIYDSWPKLTTTAELKDNLEKAREALATCKKNKDKVGPARMAKATTVHIERVLKEAAELKPEVNPDEAKPAQLALEVVEGLRKLQAETVRYLTAKD